MRRNVGGVHAADANDAPSSATPRRRHRADRVIGVIRHTMRPGRTYFLRFGLRGFFGPGPPFFVGAMLAGPAEPESPPACALGSNFRSVMPHKLDTIKYKHRPLATL